MNAKAVIAAARACLGARFRPQGRDPATGLDCLGLVLVVLNAGGHTVHVPRDYALSGSGLVERLAQGLRRAGFGQVPSLCEGDIILFEPARGQAHLAIASVGGAVIHAHLGVGRVVEAPPDPSWRVESIWRFGETN